MGKDSEMTTFTTEDREKAYGVNVDVGLVNASPPHIVDGGASIMIKEITDEQIGWFAKAYTDRKGKLNTIEFVRAILRKVQEK
jgi:hypothetical protein